MLDSTFTTWLEKEMVRVQTPGLSVAVLSGNRPVYVQGHGLANLEHNIPATADTVYEIASVSKIFTASAVMLLAD